MVKKVGLVPSRLNSSRLPEKALELIEGMPMFAHVYFRAKESSLEDVYLLTDSQKIKKVAENYNIKTCEIFINVIQVYIYYFRAIMSGRVCRVTFYCG